MYREELLTTLKKHDHLDTAKILAAFDLAERAHAKQKRDSGEPYISHPLAVATFLCNIGMDTPTIAAALLHDVVVGDKIVVYYKQDKYLYEVDEIKIVLPEDVSVLKQTPQNKLTLITCTPVGTNLKRLIVTAVPVAKNNLPIENNNAKISR